MLRKANFRSASPVSSPARNQVSDSHVGWLASAAGKTKCGSPATGSNGYRRQSSPTGTPSSFFAMLAVIATLADGLCPMKSLTYDRLYILSSWQEPATGQ